MIPFVFYVWIILTSLISAISIFSLLQPFWIVHPDGIHAFGLYVYCRSKYEGYLSNGACGPYGDKYSLVHIPSGAWQATFLLYTTGCCILLFSLVLGMGIVVMNYRWISRVSFVITYIQTTAVLVLIAALLTFPLGLTSHFFRYYCGRKSDVYDAGQCNMGWSYMLAIMATSLSVFCPVLWNLRDFKNEYDNRIFDL